MSDILNSGVRAGRLPAFDPARLPAACWRSRRSASAASCCGTQDLLGGGRRISAATCGQTCSARSTRSPLSEFGSSARPRWSRAPRTTWTPCRGSPPCSRGTVATIPMLFIGGVVLAMRKDVVLSLVLLAFIPCDPAGRAGWQARRCCRCGTNPTCTSTSRTPSCASACAASASSAPSTREAREHERIADATRVMAENIIRSNVSMGTLLAASRRCPSERGRRC